MGEDMSVMSVELLVGRRLYDEWRWVTAEG